MNNDPRCCGTGTCLINLEGVCWCGQVWDGEKMCMPKSNAESSPSTADQRVVSTETTQLQTKTEETLKNR